MESIRVIGGGKSGDPKEVSFGSFFGLLLLFLVVWSLWSSFYTVPAESEGVIQRFGKYIGTEQPGLHFKYPLGIDQVAVLPTRRQLKMEFGFYTPGASNPDQWGNDIDKEKSMVTGDLNAALVEWVVQYRIQDPKQYLYDVRNPGQTLRDLSEAAMREVIGDRTVDEVITIGRQEVEMAAINLESWWIRCSSKTSIHLMLCRTLLMR